MLYALIDVDHADQTSAQVACAQTRRIMRVHSTAVEWESWKTMKQHNHIANLE